MREERKREREGEGEGERETTPLTLEGGGPGVVVHVVLDPLVSGPLLPAQGEWQLVGHGEAGVLPLRGLALVVHKVHPAIGQHTLLWKHRGQSTEFKVQHNNRVNNNY